MIKRGSTTNPFNRFTDHGWSWDEEIPPDERGNPKTQFIQDSTASIISTNTSPDVPFDASINPYRGCEHGCVYCYARPTHEFLGYSPGIDFETKILVKQNAAQLLREQLASKQWHPRLLMLSGVTDPYQPIERKLKITRSLLEVLAEAKNPVTIITKNYLVARDIDLLAELAKYSCIVVAISITTLDPALTSVLEPRTSRPNRRLQAISKLADAGIPTGVMIAPVIPGLNDHEIPEILKAAAESGATYANYTLLRLPYALKDIFTDWLDTNYPLRKEKILNRILMFRDGKLNNSDFGSRFKGQGPIAAQVRDMFRIHVQKNGLNKDRPQLMTNHFRRPTLNGQFNMFD